MAFSYSGLTNYGKSSLPSVESWGTNNNILRDPPRSITTRRIDKVTENSFLTQELQESSDRIAEMIMAYPRGINPMVGVSYDNSNGGIGRGQALLYRGQQAKLPYRVLDKGAFRPPILAPVDLLPLSRMPRNTTCINPTIFKPDFSKKISCTHEARAVTNKKPRTNCPSTFYMKITEAVPQDVSKSIVAKPINYSINGTCKYQRAGEQRDRDTTIFIKQALTKDVMSAVSGKKSWRLPTKAQLKFKPTLKGEFSAPKTGAGLVKFELPKGQPRTKAILQGEMYTNVNGPTKNLAHTTLEKAPSKMLSYHFTAPASTNRMGGDTLDHYTPSAYSVNPKSAILLPDNMHMNAMPSMERAIPKTRLRVR